MAGEVVPFRASNGLLRKLHGSPALVDLESWRWQHTPTPDQAPKSVSDCLLLICHLRSDETVSGSGQHRWRSSWFNDEEHLRFRTHYELVRSDREVKVTITAEKWSTEILGYFPLRHTFNRWVCPTCEKKDAIVSLRTMNGQAICQHCGWKHEKHIVLALWPEGPWFWPHLHKDTEEFF